MERKHRDKPRIIAICDVSGSVARVSDFFLLLIYSLHEVVSDVRSFAFSSHLIEVSDILDEKEANEAMREIMAKAGFGSSDYGKSLADFEKLALSAVTPQTTVIVLGDARTNNLDPRATSCGVSRSGRSGWSGSIPKAGMAWGWGDSEMPSYATYCSTVRQCSTAKQLERAHHRYRLRRISSSRAPAPGRHKPQRPADGPSRTGRWSGRSRTSACSAAS